MFPQLLHEYEPACTFQPLASLNKWFIHDRRHYTGTYFLFPAQCDVASDGSSCEHCWRVYVLVSRDYNVLLYTLIMMMLSHVTHLPNILPPQKLPLCII